MTFAVLDLPDDGDLDCSSMTVLILFKALAIMLSMLGAYLQGMFTTTLEAEVDLIGIFNHLVEVLDDASHANAKFLRLGRLSLFIDINSMSTSASPGSVSPAP